MLLITQLLLKFLINKYMNVVPCVYICRHSGVSLLLLPHFLSSRDTINRSQRQHKSGRKNKFWLLFMVWPCSWICKLMNDSFRF